MDSPVLRLLLLPESRLYLGYLAWMLRNGSFSLTTSEPEAPIEVVPEPETDNTKAPESKQAGQSTAEPGADLNLISLWSMDPIPTQVPTLESSSSSSVLSGFLNAPVPSGDLLQPVSLPDFLIPSQSLVTASPLDPLAPLVAPTPPSQPVSTSPSPQPTTPSSPPQSVCPEAPLGS
ncbi:hypothetical protein DPX16_18810 [Anabarilius grahami]|uniref:Uncharacterized protein n=1 Tax=Anabarilius grahami TaxID=495550 RepID=A0A3N0Y397_ANAGA|nr:hypothetical protein DPX16_18810 [Anabarilius grahami]